MSTGLHYAVERRREDGTWEYVDLDLAALGLGHKYDQYAILADVRQPCFRVPRWWSWYALEDLIDEQIAEETIPDDSREPALTHLRHGMYQPITPPRGLPYDITEQAHAEATHSPDWHTHTWITLRDLLDYDWEAPHVMTERTPSVLAERTKEIGADAAWDEAVRQRVAQGEDPGHAAGALLLDDAINFVDVESALPYRLRVPELYGQVLPALQAVGPPDDVRVLAWFDN